MDAAFTDRVRAKEVFICCHRAFIPVSDLTWLTEGSQVPLQRGSSLGTPTLGIFPQTTYSPKGFSFTFLMDLIDHLSVYLFEVYNVQSAGPEQ